MKKLLTEYYQLQLTPEQINEATSIAPGSPLILKKVLIQRADSKNRNGRIYPKTILEREINNYIDNFVKPRRALGELDHSDSAVVNLKNVSHIINEIYWEGDDCYGDLEILDGPEFPAGRIAAGLLRRKIPVGISSRGMGSVEQIDENTVEVNDDFSLLTWDLVSYESTQGSNMKLQESVNIENNSTPNFNKIDAIIYDLICNNSAACSCIFKDK